MSNSQSLILSSLFNSSDFLSFWKLWKLWRYSYTYKTMLGEPYISAINWQIDSKSQRRMWSTNIFRIYTCSEFGAMISRLRGVLLNDCSSPIKKKMFAHLSASSVSCPSPPRDISLSILQSPSKRGYKSEVLSSVVITRPLRSIAWIRVSYCVNHRVEKSAVKLQGRSLYADLNSYSAKRQPSHRATVTISRRCPVELGGLRST